MTEKLLTGTLSLNTNNQPTKYEVNWQNPSAFQTLVPFQQLNRTCMWHFTQMIGTRQTVGGGERFGQTAVWLYRKAIKRCKNWTANLMELSVVTSNHWANFMFYNNNHRHQKKLKDLVVDAIKPFCLTTVNINFLCLQLARQCIHGQVKYKGKLY